MRRQQHHRRGWVVLGLLLSGALLGGCVENRASVTVSRMLVPDSNCVASADSDSFLTMGTFDIGEQGNLPTQYFVYPRVVNNMVSTTEAEGVELNWVELIEARLTLDFGAVGAGLDADTTQFRYPAFVTLAPGEAAAVQVLAIPEATARVIASQLPNEGDSVIVRVRIKFLYQFGEYEHETHEVEFPVQVCRHCLIAPLEQRPACYSDEVSDPILQGNQCNIVQDVPVDCCQLGSRLVCPAVGSTDTGTTG